jgi:hypothetical protein
MKGASDITAVVLNPAVKSKAGIKTSVGSISECRTPTRDRIGVFFYLRFYGFYAVVVNVKIHMRLYCEGALCSYQLRGFDKHNLNEFRLSK